MKDEMAKLKEMMENKVPIDELQGNAKGKKLLEFMDFMVTSGVIAGWDKRTTELVACTCTTILCGMWEVDMPTPDTFILALFLTHFFHILLDNELVAHHTLAMLQAFEKECRNETI